MFRDLGIDAAYAGAWALTRRVPDRVARGAFARIADLAWRRRGSGVVRLEQNLARVVPGASPAELRELCRAGMRSYLRYWYEAFRLPTWSRDEVIARVIVHEEPRLRDAIARGGVIVALPHQGNWDLAGAWACATGTPLTTVAERLRPERLYDRFVAYREGLGMEILPANGPVDRNGPWDRLATLAERLRDGRLVCLVADRDLSERGVEVAFFGEPARMPAGPATLALRTGATLLPVTLWYDVGERMHLHFSEAIRPPADGPPGPTMSKVYRMTQALADVFAAGIRAHPADWHMLQRVWVGKR